MASQFASWNEYTRFVIALTAVLDPFIAVPLFVAMTVHRGQVERRALARVVTLTVAAVLIGAAFAGEAILRLIGGSLASFRVGGGLVLLLMALAMLNARTGDVRQTQAEALEAEGRAGVGAGVVPLAIPMLAGPGAISTVIIAVHQASVVHQLAVIGCIALVSLLLWAILRGAARIGRAFGTTGLNVANRLLGLLLVAIAIETMATGMRQLFPALGAP